MKLLICLSDEDIRSDEGYYLAAVCTLRSYEILAEDFDPNRHLSGAFALSAASSIAMDRPSLRKGGFFNYLREDITFSLMNRRVLKIDLTAMRVPETGLDDEDQLNIGALYLAEAINFKFGQNHNPSAYTHLGDRLETWKLALPEHFHPFFDSSASGATCVFPTIRILRDCHVAVLQYYLVTKILLHQCLGLHHDADPTSLASTNAARICGLAFTSNSPAVLVNSFGPISYCGRFIRAPSLQVDLIRRLHACGKETGWPVQRMIDDLNQVWRDQNTDSVGSQQQISGDHQLMSPD